MEKKDKEVIIRLSESPACGRELEQEGIVSHNGFSRIKKRLMIIDVVKEDRIDNRKTLVSLTEKGEKIARELNEVFE
jgi:DNA-binding MarR family transcriptional regulator